MRDLHDPLHQPKYMAPTLEQLEGEKTPERPRGTLANMTSKKTGGLGRLTSKLQGGLGQTTKKSNPKGGIQLKDTPYGKVRIYKVSSGNYPLQIVEDTQLRDIYELALLQHPTIVQKAGLIQKGYFDYNAVVSVSRQDRNFKFWIQGFAKKWIVYPGDELLLDKLPGLTIPKEKKQEQETIEYRKATDWENWLKRNVSPDEAGRVFDALGGLGGRRYKGLQILIKKKGLDPEKDKEGVKKILFEMIQNKEKHWPSGAADLNHPIHGKMEIDGKKVHLFQPSKKYPGLFTQDEKYFYYASPTGTKKVPTKDLKDNKWKKYILVTD